MITAASRVRPPAGLLVSDLGSELVFLELNSEQYFGLDSVGKAVWDRLTASPDVGTAIESLLDEFDVDRAALEEDVERLAEQLVQLGLLEIHDARPA